MSRRSYTVFFLLAIYIFLAWVWWTWSLVDLRLKEYNRSVDQEIAQAKEARQFLEYWLTTTPHPSIPNLLLEKNRRYPRLALLHKGNDLKPNAWNIIPNPEYLNNLREFRNRKITQYLLEAGVFLVLMFWGIFYILRNYRKSENMKLQQQNFILAVTHELKTPVATIKLMLQTLERKSIPQDQEKLFISKTLDETNRLEKLTENILTATRLESYPSASNLNKINLSEMVLHVCHSFMDQNPERLWELQIPSEMWIDGDFSLLELLLSNMLTNSLKYSPSDKIIHVNVMDDEEYIFLKIHDFGEPIPPEERKKIFNKFYRLGNEDTRKTKGTGIGLYLVKQIVNLHRGDIQVETSSLGGNIWSLRFPKPE